MRRAAILAAALALAAAPLAGQTCSTSNPGGTCTVNVTVSSVTFPTLIGLTISSTTATLTAPALANFGVDSSATMTDAALTTVTARGNVGFHVTMAAGQANWTTTGTPPTPKPASDLAWESSLTSSYVPVSTTPATIISSPTRSNAIAISLSFRTKWNFIQNTSGTYSLPLVFTLVSP